MPPAKLDVFEQKQFCAAPDGFVLLLTQAQSSKAAEPPAKLDVFEQKQFCAAPDGFVLLLT